MAFSTASASTDPRRETCMSLPISCIPGPQSKSFEEVRIADYLASYRSTGRLPQPCPPFPTAPTERAALRLPPLFVPKPFADLLAQPGAASSSAGAGPSVPAITDPAALPLPQAFTATVSAPEGEMFASIAAAPMYMHWSHDELRYYAYARGAHAPPPNTPMFSFASAVMPAAAAAPTLQDGSNEKFESIVCRPEYAGHSVEELRLSFLRTGRELTSAQIFTGASSSSTSLPHAPHQPPLFSTPTPALAPPISLAPPQPQQPTVFGAQPQGLFAHSQHQHQPQAQPLSFSSAPALAAPASFSFGSAPPPQQPPAPGGFSFGSAPPLSQPQNSQPQQPAPGGFSFGAAPAPSAPTGFSFGATSAEAGGEQAGGGGAFSFRRRAF
ncbi:hypothetical protein B0H10DRAFT_1998375 [Mycena sp. CBHHK59/15]|nr:hypothetical protein B0H10DRAFT_1998375 [Mycena sp. CBHHK59/15]